MTSAMVDRSLALPAEEVGEALLAIPEDQTAANYEGTPAGLSVEDLDQERL